MVSALVISLLKSITLDAAIAEISAVRDVEIDKVLKEAGLTDWLREQRRLGNGTIVQPRPQFYLMSERSIIHIGYDEDHALSKHRQGGKPGDRVLTNIQRTTDRLEAQARDQRFCGDCLKKTPASWHPRYA